METLLEHIDIKKYEIDEFVIGDDWSGKFDYLKEYCNVTYLSKTKKISTTKIENDLKHINLPRKE